MAGRRWVPKPTDPIGDKEAIGRRLFDEPALSGALDQPPRELLDFRNFEEKRIPIEVSFDRLGKTGPEPKVKAFLDPLGVALGQALTPRRQFHGWSFLKTETLAKPPRGPGFPLTISMIEPDDKTHKDHNPYHVHALVTDKDWFTTSLLLQHLFSKHGTLERCPSNPPPAPVSSPSAAPGAAMPYQAAPPAPQAPRKSFVRWLWESILGGRD